MEDIFKSLIVLFLCAVPGLIFIGLQSLFKSSDDEVDLVDGSQNTKETNSLVRSEVAVQKPVEEKPQAWVPLSERSRIARAQRKVTPARFN